MNTTLLTYFYLKGSSIYHLSFFRHLQYLKPTCQIPINVHTKFGKIELFITFDREMISTELFTSYLSLQEETTDVTILIGDFIILNGTSISKKLFLTQLSRHSASAFGFHEKWRTATWKTFFSTCRI